MKRRLWLPTWIHLEDPPHYCCLGRFRWLSKVEMPEQFWLDRAKQQALFVCGVAFLAVLILLWLMLTGRHL